MKSRNETDVEVFCNECGVSCGYVVVDGHKDWLRECHGGGKFVAINTDSDDVPNEQEAP